MVRLPDFAKYYSTPRMKVYIVISVMYVAFLYGNNKVLNLNVGSMFDPERSPEKSISQ